MRLCLKKNSLPPEKCMVEAGVANKKGELRKWGPMLEIVDTESQFHELKLSPISNLCEDFISVVTRTEPRLLKSNKKGFRIQGIDEDSG